MGKGPGCRRVPISLANYQQRVGNDVMTVNGSTYTFTAGNHSVGPCDEIVFGDNEVIVVPLGSTVTLYGEFNITESSMFIALYKRISVFGSLILENGSLIDIDEVRGNEQAVGLFIEAGGSFKLKRGSKIEISSIDDKARGIKFDTNSSIHLDGGVINITTITNAAGIEILASVTMDEGTEINIENVYLNLTGNNRSLGIANGNITVYPPFTMNGGSITVENVEGFIEGTLTDNVGIGLVNLIQNGGELRVKKSVRSFGIFLSKITQNDGLIQIDEVTNKSFGMVYTENEANPGSLNQNGGVIKLRNIDSDSVGFFTLPETGVELGTISITQTGGSFIIENVEGPFVYDPDGSSGSLGLGMSLLNTLLTQSGDGIIRVNGIQNNGAGIVMSLSDADSSRAQITNLAISSSDDTGIGLLLAPDEGNFTDFANNGQVDVSGTSIAYTIDGTSELFGQPEFSTYFKGPGTYTKN